ncbi:MAG: hypothetical protein ACFFG0_03850 [Candidatus Thorarchaeota archaeon]
MDQCKHCSFSLSINCFVKLDERIKLNKEICPCSICLVKASCNIICKERRNFFKYIAQVPDTFEVNEAKRVKVKGW